MRANKASVGATNSPDAEQEVTVEGVELVIIPPLNDNHPYTVIKDGNDVVAVFPLTWAVYYRNADGAAE